MNRKSFPSSTVALAALAGGAMLWRWLADQRYSLEDRIVVITGGSRGLGLAMAREFCAQGARVALLARDRAELDRAAKDLVARGAEGRIITIACDVRQEGAAAEALETVVAYWGGVDVLVNNAGVITVGPWQTMTERDFDEAMALHFWAPLYAMRAAIPHLKRSSFARIVNVSSFGGKIAVPHMAPYCASKFALVGLSDALRNELRSSAIRVTTVCPGLLRTGSHLNAFFKGDFEREYAWFAAGAAMPGNSMSATSAARRIVLACRRGEAQLILTWKARAAVLAQALAPNLTARVLAEVSRWMPQAGLSEERRSGWDSRGMVSPEVTRRADAMTEELNGLRGHARV